MYHNEMKKVIEKVVKPVLRSYGLDPDQVKHFHINPTGMDSFDCEKIYDSDEELITDAFFTLKHYAGGEEEVSKDEWLYFLECLEGRREYNIEDKMRITTKPSHRQA